MENTVVIRQTADSDTREYHCSKLLTEVPYAQVLDTEMNNGESFAKLGDTLRGWLGALEGTGRAGIIKMTMRPQSIKVTKYPHVPWTELEPEIESAFDTVLGITSFTFLAKAAREKVLA